MNAKIFLPVLIYATFVLFVFIAGSAYAQVSYFPQQFYGSVTINGVPAPDGVLVSAKHNGHDVAGGLTEGGKYGYGRPAFVVALHSSYEGDTLEFYVQNVKAAEYPFMPGESTKLDLSVTIPNFCGDGKCESGESCSSCPKDCGSCAPPGGGGSSGGSGGSFPSGGGAPSSGGTEGEEPEETGPCVEEWICTDWSECFNGRQKRVCADINRCGTEKNKPAEQQECVMPVICEPGERTCRGNFVSECSPSGTVWVDVDECESGCMDGECLEERKGTDFTGMITSLPAAAGAIAGLLVIIVLGLYLVKFRKKR